LEVGRVIKAPGRRRSQQNSVASIEIFDGILETTSADELRRYPDSGDCQYHEHYF
jgi:hypothetical protein